MMAGMNSSFVAKFGPMSIPAAAGNSLVPILDRFERIDSLFGINYGNYKCPIRAPLSARRNGSPALRQPQLYRRQQPVAHFE
jgi:hypothetical protein